MLEVLRSGIGVRLGNLGPKPCRGLALSRPPALQASSFFPRELTECETSRLLLESMLGLAAWRRKPAQRLATTPPLSPLEKAVRRKGQGTRCPVRNRIWQALFLTACWWCVGSCTPTPFFGRRSPAKCTQWNPLEGFADENFGMKPGSHVLCYQPGNDGVLIAYIRTHVVVSTAESVRTDLYAPRSSTVVCSTVMPLPSRARMLLRCRKYKCRSAGGCGKRGGEGY